ncbi:MAG: glutathione synthase [Synechococcales cyanobacterium RU_4_20]|nr:glutathione synthase [Synechococcales cyanobacterium RU_4_20]NJR70502.1 glutathione synthase [Synechococcales cyanobacterium CRU_2_2]
MKLAFIIDPIDRLDPGHDSTVAMMEAAYLKGHEVWITAIDQLHVVEGKAWAKLQSLRFKPVRLVDGRWEAPSDWYRVEAEAFLPLEVMQAVFMRKDPPADAAYFYATFMLDYVDPAKTLVINSPDGLRKANEKMYALQFPSAMPKTQVSTGMSQILKFVEQNGKAVLKPLDGKAGEGILFLEWGDRNLKSMIEISTQRGQRPVMLQEYLPAAREGDKRIILLEGEPIGAVNRVPAADEFRGNMAVGGRADATVITPREQEICAQVGPVVQRDGLYFVGIDVIGGFLTEVNVTSPTGIREIDRLSDVRLGDQVIEWLERRLLQ